MKPIYSHRFRFVFSLFAVLFYTGTQQAIGQEFSVYDNIQQLENRISQAGNATLVINFWATWCKPCVEELPCFDELKTQNPDHDIQVLLVSLDFKSQIEKKFVPFLRNQKLQSEVVLLADQDVNTWIPKIYEDWDGAIPATVVLRNGKRKFSLGKFDSIEELNAFVQPFLVDASTMLKPVTCGGK
jgi:thiol-disulfide isomerase/thioredoxin